MRLDPSTLGSCPEPKADPPLLIDPGVPILFKIKKNIYYLTIIFIAPVVTLLVKETDNDIDSILHTNLL